jgi:hypothetical protein
MARAAERDGRVVISGMPAAGNRRGKPGMNCGVAIHDPETYPL